jgi:hypothetical protein
VKFCVGVHVSNFSPTLGHREAKLKKREKSELKTEKNSAKAESRQSELSVITKLGSLEFTSRVVGGSNPAGFKKKKFSLSHTTPGVCACLGGGEGCCSHAT